MDFVYTGFAKLFDKLNLALILDKLANLDSSRSMVQLFKSYLNDRWQKIVFNGHVSGRYEYGIRCISGCQCRTVSVSSVYQ